MADNSRLPFIDNELKKFNVTDSAIAELSEQYMPLIVKGIDDKEGLKVVNAARKVVKGYRIDVDKRRKELNADALEYQRHINGEAKRITALLEPIESHLANEEKKIDDEITRIKLEKEQAEAEKLRERINTLIRLGFKFDGIKYITEYLDTFNNALIEIAMLHVKQIDDATWDDFTANAYHYQQMDLTRKVEEIRLANEKQEREEAERKAEADRLIQQRREQEMENERLADIAHMQAKKEAELKAEAERLESLKQYEESKAAVIASETECLKNECEAPTHFTFKQSEDQAPFILNINNHGEKRIGGVYTEKPISVSMTEPELKEIAKPFKFHAPVKRDVCVMADYISYMHSELSNEQINKVLEFVEDRIDGAIKRCIAESVHDVLH